VIQREDEISFVGGGLKGSEKKGEEEREVGLSEGDERLDSQRRRESKRTGKDLSLNLTDRLKRALSSAVADLRVGFYEKRKKEEGGQMLSYQTVKEERGGPKLTVVLFSMWSIKF